MEQYLVNGSFRCKCFSLHFFFFGGGGEGRVIGPYYMISIKLVVDVRFCDHSRNFAKVNSKFLRICKKCLRELIISVEH